ncbi:hypothetical protein JXB02_00960 [Candidatus Woesearchaeota archaeon]|nr:hypothetical protein [Candidatus Woesearchaeota archaeon]
MSKKAQAAMEFLMTYGWAILVVLAAIGALAYFGVLSPDRFMPTKCTASGGFSCIDHKVTATNVQLYMQQNLGFDATDVVIELRSVDGTLCGTNTTNASYTNGQQFTATFTCANAGTFKGDMKIWYVNSNTNVGHVTSGSVTGRVE